MVRVVGGSGWRVRLPAPPRPKDMTDGWVGAGSRMEMEVMVGAGDDGSDCLVECGGL